MSEPPLFKTGFLSKKTEPVKHHMHKHLLCEVILTQIISYANTIYKSYTEAIHEVTKYFYSQYFNKLTLHGNKHTATETKITIMELIFSTFFLNCCCSKNWANKSPKAFLMISVTSELFI